MEIGFVKIVSKFFAVIFDSLVEIPTLRCAI